MTDLPLDEDECADNGLFMYGIEYVLGGKLFNLRQCDLNYTTATAEGLVDASNSGHLRRVAAAATDGETQERELNGGGVVKESRAMTTTMVDTPLSNRKPGRPPGSKNKVKISMPLRRSRATRCAEREAFCRPREWFYR